MTLTTGDGNDDGRGRDSVQQMTPEDAQGR